MLFILLSSVSFTFAAVSAYLYLSRDRLKNAYSQDLKASTTAYSNLESSYLEAKNIIKSLEDKVNQLLQASFESETKANSYKIRLEEHIKRLEDWEKTKEDSINIAKAAVFEVGNKLSHKLLEEHKRETQEARSQSEKINEKNTNKFLEQFENITKTVATLSSKVKESTETVDLVKRTLLSPTAIGNLGEVTLENLLKNIGLQIGRDFIMQYSMTGSDTNSRQRPDSVIFLPNDDILVVDSKASKFFFDEQDNNDERIKTSIYNHLKTLASKEYKENIRSHLLKSKEKESIRKITTIMFLPTESIIEKIHSLDHLLIEKCAAREIILAGPVGLVNLLNYAKFVIVEYQQQQNHQIIFEEVKKLAAGIAVMSEHAKKLGNAMYSAVNNYDKFAGSFNVSLLSKLRNLVKLGVEIPANKSITQLDRLQLVTNNNDLIDVELNNDEKLIKKLETSGNSGYKSQNDKVIVE